MVTIPSTTKDFYADCAKFMRIMGDRSHSQDAVKGAHKALTLRYLGISGASVEEIEACAIHLEIATSGAMARGWNL